MGFRINTNTAALAAHANATMNNRALDSSLSKLNSGFRITSAADDASGMAIADSLRSQANALGQAIMNANDAIGVILTADKAMDEVFARSHGRFCASGEKIALDDLPWSIYARFFLAARKIAA